MAQSVVQISSVALFRIAKHCDTSNVSTVSTGCLLGLDNEATDLVEVTNVFAHPPKGAADFLPQQSTSDEASSSTAMSVDNPLGAANSIVSIAQNFQSESVRLLKLANMEGNIVGWFQSSTFLSFVNEATIDIQFDYQNSNPNSVLIIYDNTGCNFGGSRVPGTAAVSQSKHIKAFRLSKEYMQYHRAMKERKGLAPATLITGGAASFNPLVDSVFNQVSIKPIVSILDEAFLFENGLVKGGNTLPTAKNWSSEKVFDTTNILQQLSEVVEDIVIENVRYNSFNKITGSYTTGGRIRGGDEETKRIQSGNDLIQLIDNAKRLCQLIECASNQSLIVCNVYEAVSLGDQD